MTDTHVFSAGSIFKLDCDLAIAAAGVRVWQAWLGEALPEGIAETVLSDDESQRARRFVFDRHRRRWVAARVALRTILAECLGESPGSLTFTYGAHGKPELGQRWQSAGLQFNLAHSGDWALIAVGWERRVGIDLEEMREEVVESGIAERYFSPREAAQLRSLPRDLQQIGFFRCWTRKEAYLKALGCGISGGLQSFEVSLLPDEPPALRCDQSDERAPDKWRMAELVPAAGYLAAVVAEVDPALANKRQAS
jgi:4'-phosphopantetheinyl transferase